MAAEQQTTSDTSDQTSSPQSIPQIWRRLGLWPLRVAWLGCAIGVGRPAIHAADQFDGSGPLIVETWLWGAWFIGVVAILVPAPASLTAIRLLSSGSISVAVLGLVLTNNSRSDLWLALAVAIGVTALSFQPVVGDLMVNGSAYGSERRMPLRPPGFALVGPVQVAWLLVMLGALSGPILMASGWLIAGIGASLVGLGAIWAGVRVLHQLARRWVVFVPAGFVIHDPVVLIESILLGRTKIVALGPASIPLDDQATDLGRGARGLALAVRPKAPVEFAIRKPGVVESTTSSVLVFNPSLPGAVLKEARARAIPIGEA